MAEPRATLAFRPSGRVIRAADAAAYGEARELLAEAQRIRERARDEARQAFAAERARGYAEGRAEGAAEGARLLAATTAGIDDYLAGMEDRLAQLMLAAIAQILGSFDVRELVVQAACHAAEQARSEQRLTLFVPPDQAEDVRRTLAARLLAVGRTGLVQVEIDPKLAGDACVLASPAGFVELGVQAQLAALAAALGVADAPAAG